MDHQKNRFQRSRWFLGAVLLLLVNITYAQTTSVSGVVLDAGTKDPIPFASVYFKGGKGVTADSTGHYDITTARILNELVFSYIGYKPRTVRIKVGAVQTINVELPLDASKDLSNLVVKSKKKINYRNKDNPAVELIRRVIANRDKKPLGVL